jgi:hypothetical protein
MKSIKDSWDDLTLDSAKFVLDQAEKNIQASLETAKNLTDRAVNVMQFSIPLAFVLIGLISGNPEKPLLFLYIIGLFFALAVSYKGLKLYDLYLIQPLGYLPSNLIKEENLKLEEKYQELGFIFSVIQDMERVIEINETKNLERQMKMYSIMEWVKTGIVLTCLYPVFLFVFGVLK